MPSEDQLNLLLDSRDNLMRKVIYDLEASVEPETHFMDTRIDGHVKYSAQM